MADVVVTRVRRRSVAGRPRNLQERLIVRFPTAYRRFAALAFRWLRPGSRLRRELLGRALDTGWSSIDRRDFELNVVLFSPDIEFEVPTELQTLGLEPIYRGREPRLDGIRSWLEAWGTTEMEPEYMIDLGNRLLLLGQWHNRALTSGADLNQPHAQLVTVRGGLIIRDQNFISWAEGIQAAGLPPDVIDAAAAS